VQFAEHIVRQGLDFKDAERTFAHCTHADLQRAEELVGQTVGQAEFVPPLASESEWP